MVFDRSICNLTEGTLLEEKNLRCKGDLIFSDRSKIERNIITDGRIFLGELVDVEGDLIAIGDIRIDKGSHVKGDVTGDNDIYIGERSVIAGNLVVGKNLDVGEGVQIDPKAIDSRGRVNIRNPISVLVYLLIYLLELLKKNDSKEVEEFFKELEKGGEENILISKDFTFFPRGSKLTHEKLSIPGNLRIGPRSHLVSDLEVSGDLFVEHEVEVFGNITAKGSVVLGENSVINGNIRSGSEVNIQHAARIGGDIKASYISVTHDTIIEGSLRGEEGIRILPSSNTTIDERLERFQNGLDDLKDLMG